MKVCIHRGTREIGGTCIEVEARDQRLVLDIGLPLNADPCAIQLPPVKGFVEHDPTLLGVVISHPHQDHYGLAGRLPKRVPVLIGTAAESILKAALPFFPGAVAFDNVIPLRHRKPIQLGPFSLTPYTVDHSAYDSYAVMLEADGKRLFYSGDFRGHGRTGNRFQELLDKPPRDVDTLLLEGTLVGQSDGRACRTEDELMQDMLRIIKATKGLVLVCCSGQNIDRLVTVFKAARKAKRQLIVDGYTAHILRATGNQAIPQSDWDGVRVFWPGSLRSKVKSTEQFHLVGDLKGSRITPDGLEAEASCSVMLFRPSVVPDLDRAFQCLSEASLIYSLWPGYLKNEDTKPFREWLDKRGIPLHYCHTSGHASLSQLKDYVTAIDPRVIVPVHTLARESFSGMFRDVQLKDDGEWWGVGEE